MNKNKFESHLAYPQNIQNLGLYVDGAVHTRGKTTMALYKRTISSERPTARTWLAMENFLAITAHFLLPPRLLGPYTYPFPPPCIVLSASQKSGGVLRAPKNSVLPLPSCFLGDAFLVRRVLLTRLLCLERPVFGALKRAPSLSQWCDFKIPDYLMAGVFCVYRCKCLLNVDDSAARVLSLRGLVCLRENYTVKTELDFRDFLIMKCAPLSSSPCCPIYKYQETHVGV